MRRLSGALMAIVATMIAAQTAPVFADARQVEDGLWVDVSLLERGLEPVNPAFPPEPGTQYVAAQVRLGVPYGLAVPPQAWRYSDFRARVDGVIYRHALAHADVSGLCRRCSSYDVSDANLTLSGIAESGSAAEFGWVTFEVPADARNIDILYRDEVWSGLSDIDGAGLRPPPTPAPTAAPTLSARELRSAAGSMTLGDQIIVLTIARCFFEEQPRAGLGGVFTHTAQALGATMLGDQVILDVTRARDEDGTVGDDVLVDIGELGSDDQVSLSVRGPDLVEFGDASASAEGLEMQDSDDFGGDTISLSFEFDC